MVNKRGAGLALDRAYMAAVDAIMVQLVQAIAADGIVGHAGQQGGLAAQFAKTRRDIGG